MSPHPKQPPPPALQKHTLPRPDRLQRTSTVLDIGPGIRPMGWWRPKRHVCIEPHGPYADALEEAGYIVIRETAQDALPKFTERFDSVMLLDVIEHMTRKDGERVLDMALGLAQEQVVVYTPVGFVEQGHDAWDMGGEWWQTHRSGWTPEDFPDWRISYHAHGFCAMWDVRG